MTRYHVVPFHGQLIGGGHRKCATDFHVCDERGRTAAVVPWTVGGGSKYRRARAERLAQRLTAEHAASGTGGDDGRG